MPRGGHENASAALARKAAIPLGLVLVLVVLVALVARVPGRRPPAPLAEPVALTVTAEPNPAAAGVAIVFRVEDVPEALLFSWTFTSSHQRHTAEPCATFAYDRPGLHLAAVEVTLLTGKSRRGSVLVGVAD
jgi:hypothetical protein